MAMPWALLASLTTNWSARAETGKKRSSSESRHTLMSLISLGALENPWLPHKYQRDVQVQNSFSSPVALRMLTTYNVQCVTELGGEC